MKRIWGAHADRRALEGIEFSGRENGAAKGT